MGTPAADEKVLWKGKPDRALLARSAFHTRGVAIYFAALIAVSLAFGNVDSAMVCAVLGVLGLIVLQGLAWLSARSTLYILTDIRVIMRIGMALETRINIPLKHVRSAHLKMQGADYGDIALELNGERMLGTMLLWPHARPWHFTKPQPMLRAIPQAEEVASMLADTCARYNRIERGAAETAAQVNGPARGLEGAPA